MRLRIAEDVLALFPEALIGVVRVRGCDNAGQSPEIAALLRLAEAGARAAFTGTALTEEPRIACWREAYRAFGASPKKNPSSIENLLRRVVKGEANASRATSSSAAPAPPSRPCSCSATPQRARRTPARSSTATTSRPSAGAGTGRKPTAPS